MDAKKQTTVEWLYGELSKNNISNDSIKSRIYKESEIWKQSLAMEKEQMGDAYYDGKNNGMDICNPLSRAKGISFEQYYNDTYKLV